MISLGFNCFLVETATDLPALPVRIGTLYVDTETSSNDPKEMSINPWRREHCRLIGAPVTWDDNPNAYFIPKALAGEWLQSAFDRADVWCNHNIKYDAHVLVNELGVKFRGTYKDTLSHAKIFDADRTYKGGYSLAILSEQLCDYPIAHFETTLAPYLVKNKDYGRIPLDVLALYGCMDVHAVRRLHHWLNANIPEESAWVVQNEDKLISVLLDIEATGMRAEERDIKIQLLRSMHQMLKIEAELKEMLSVSMNPNSPKDCYDALINVFGFPPIIDPESTTGNASFSADVLAQYMQLEMEPEALRCVELVSDYRYAAHTKSLFWEPWLELMDENFILHPDYNPNVRSGRTSCKRPNAQQLHKLAKLQVRARDGRKLLCYDYSQLEYRWMIHYLNNESAVQAYNKDPLTDYHEWVAAELCKGLIRRRPAKTLNFTIGFGGGKALVIHMLSLDQEVMEMCGGDKRKASEFATKVYYDYHRNLPELKQHSGRAERAALMNGYVRTIYGRRLHLPPAFAHKGFNRVIQSTAADCNKEGLVLASPVFNKVLRDYDAKLIATVHDEFLYDVPSDPEAIAAIDAEVVRCLQEPSWRCRVPILASAGPAADNWKEAKGD